MDRRTFIAGASICLAAPLAVEAQQLSRAPRIGILSAQSYESTQASWHVFRQGLRERGWEDGKNIIVDARFADGNFDRLPALAEELLKQNVSVLVAVNSPATRAAMRATRTLPIVMVEVGDPVATGFVASLANPGGNVTGLTTMAVGLTQKRLELLKEAVPTARRIAVTMQPDNPIVPPQWRDAQVAANRLGVHLEPLEVRNRDDLTRAFQTAADGKAEAVLQLADALNTVFGAETVELTMRYRLPIMLVVRAQVERGGLMSYWPDRLDYYRRAASYVDRILKGARPTDLPVEQPSRFELVINVKTARAFGLAISPSLLLRADQVIE